MDKLNLKANLIQGDFMAHDLSKYDIIFINPDKPFNKGLEQKLIKEMRGILLVYNQIYRPENMKKGITYWFDYIPVTVYTISF